MPAAIKHLVVLMMENRSFDHMLGFMKSPTYGIDGVDGTQLNRDSTGEPVTVNKNAQPTGDLPADPSHDFEDVMEQMFGTQTPQPGQQPAMSGFVQNYERFAGSPVRAHSIMNCFDPVQLPILTTLASSYAVCDRWFSSVPGPTIPNRVYAHAGTSRGRLDLSPDFLGGFHTVYEALLKNNVSSTIFYEDWTAALSFEGLLLHNQAEYFAEYARFAELVGNNRLPSYCFIEPRYNPQDNGDGTSLPPNDQHPPDHDVAQGEELIRTVYEDLRSNDDIWKSSILVVVYDEHGGLFDHALPPNCVSPDDIVCPSPSFDFTRLGPRVPALIISPYVQPGQIDNQNIYDHTSLIATAMKLFAGPAWPSNVLGKRAQAANTFDKILDLNMQPRMEWPNFAAAPAPAAAVTDIAAAAAPLSKLQQEAINHASILNQRLPPHLQVTQDPSEIQDEHAAGQYLSQVADGLRQMGAGVRSNAQN